MRASHFLALLVLVAGAGRAAAEDRMHWQPNLEAAQRLAAQSDKLVLVHFWSPSCQPCMRMDTEVFAKPETSQALEANFVPVKLNVDEFPATARLYGVTRIPADLIVTPSNRLVAQFQSPQTAVQYISQMNRLATGYRELANSGMAPGGAVQTSGAVTTDSKASYNGPPSQAAYGDERYEAYLKSHPPQALASAPRTNAPQVDPRSAGAAQPPMVSYGQNDPAAGAPQQQPMTPPVAQMQSARSAPVTGIQPPLTTQPTPYAAPAMPSAQYAQQQPQRPAAPTLPPGSPPLGLDGYSPVSIAAKQKWTQGSPQWGAIHRGRTYLFISQEEQQMFLANPDAYSPVNSCNDPVLSLDQGQTVAGTRTHGVLYHNRVYLFSSEDTLKRFNQNPTRYAADVMQAVRPTGPVR